MQKHIDKISHGNKMIINFAVLGGQEPCRTLLETVCQDALSFFDICIAGVYDPDPEAEGTVLAQKMGIFTTTRIDDIFDIGNIDGIFNFIEDKDLENRCRKKAKDLPLLDQNGFHLFKSLWLAGKDLMFKKSQFDLKKLSYDVLFQQSNLGIVVLNTDFSVVDANSTYLKAVNQTYEQVIGKNCYEIIKGLHMPCSFAQMGFECPLSQTMRTGKSAMVIFEYLTPKNRTVYFNVATYPIKDEQGNIVLIIELWREITAEISTHWEKHMRRMETDMQKVIQEDRMISLGTLVASCVHEINNPIQGMLTFSHLMQRILSKESLLKEEISELKHFTNLMADELSRCGEIISGLLSFSRESAVDYGPLDVNEVIRSVISLTRHKMELSNINLYLNLAPSLPNMIGDINQLQQCFINLIFNAIEVMPQGGDLYVTSESLGKHSRFEIKDTGCGISLQDLDHIFDPFFTTKEEGKGIGLGLSIVYGIVKSHRGDIKVDTQVGKGTSFVLIFPVT